MPRSGRSRGFAAAGCALILIGAGCSSESDADKIDTIEPAVAAVSPATSVQPAGTVRPLDTPIDFLVADDDTGLVAALGGTGTTLSIIDPKTPSAVPRAVDLGGQGASVARGRPGEVLVPTRERVVRVDLRSGTSTDIPLTGDLRSAQLLGDGRTAVGAAGGTVRIVGPDSTVAETVSGLASVDGIAVTGDSVSVLDRRQTSLTEIDLAQKRLGLALRAGDGATNVATDHFGRILVIDTAGNELLVFTAAPLVLRQRFPVGSSPYAVAYDQRSETAWVTLTASNEVVGYDLATGIPKEVRRYPTVRQPNALAVDSRTGDLYVGSAAGGGLQTIEGGR